MTEVVYLPGLGDQYVGVQTILLKFWRLFGLKVHVMQINWAGGESFAPKLERIIKLIDSLATSGDKIGLVGVSAGGSAAINAYIEQRDKIVKVVFICGKLHGANNVNPRYYSRNPAFKDSIFLTDQNVKKLTAEDKAKMLSLRARYDNIVRAGDSQLPGMQTKIMISSGHILSIIVGLTLYARQIARFIKLTN